MEKMRKKPSPLPSFRRVRYPPPQLSDRTHNSVTADSTATAPPDTGSVVGTSVVYSRGPSGQRKVHDRDQEMLDPACAATLTPGFQRFLLDLSCLYQYFGSCRTQTKRVFLRPPTGSPTWIDVAPDHLKVSMNWLWRPASLTSYAIAADGHETLRRNLPPRPDKK